MSMSPERRQENLRKALSARDAKRKSLQFIRLDRCAEAFGSSSRGLVAFIRDMNDKRRAELAEMIVTDVQYSR